MKLFSLVILGLILSHATHDIATLDDSILVHAPAPPIVTMIP